MDIENYIRSFGIKTFVTKAVRHVLLKNDSTIAWKINNYNEKNIENYLEKTINKSYGKIENYNIKKINQNVVKEPIWVMWYQGIENAPDIVRCCVNSIKVNSNGHDVIILSKDNLSEYIQLPNFITEKFEKGYISPTHLSDMIRLNLLYLYGGAWLDATLFVTHPIPEAYFNKPIFSINFGKNTKDPSHGRWTTCCLFSNKENMLIEKTLRCHYCYWLENDYAVDYIMFDYFINYLIKHNSKFMLDIYNIPITNQKVFELINVMNEGYEKNKILLVKDNQYFYKLSWKKTYIEQVNSYDTIFKYIKRQYMFI